MANRWGIPDLGFGIGLRTVHFPHILAEHPPVDWFEVLSENFMDSGGRPAYVLDRVAERYPVAMHGVSLSIGSTDPLNFAHLAKLKRLARRTRARWISDHLCWTGVSGLNTHDLLPMPYTSQSLRYVAERVRIVSDYLEQPLILENPSSYLEFAGSTWTECDFLAELADLSGCGVLLDVNNVYVSAFNHGFDPVQYIDRIPEGSVVQIHLAGHTHKGTHILDTHSDHVVEDVWRLYAHACRRFGTVSTLLEWDEAIPAFDVVHAEVLKAGRFLEDALHAA
ncbi:MAG: DUF692 domain-containing protein [Bryobacterales bacterium]|nr:DUF692 domain-containing protein [Bryobacterales bacterium]